MRMFRRAMASVALLATLVLASSSHASLFSDDDARRAILDIRTKVDALSARLDAKADKSSSLNLADQSDRLNQELAKLRGQIEVLTNELANTQQRQKDFYVDLDMRLRKLEPQKISVDGQEVSVAAGEQKVYDAALAAFKASDYKNASVAFADFLRANPSSGLAPSAQYWLGNAYYAQRDYKNAIAAQQTLINKYPGSPKVADAMLNISSSYIELKNKPASKKTLEQLIAQYPNTSAAQTAKERLDSFK